MGNKNTLDLRGRSNAFTNLEGQTFDILIIGAGITGCGVARDAAMRGLSVVIVDAGDLGSGTSGRTSKLIHGGLRYLAQGDISMVREAAIERQVVRAIAPHLAQPVQIVIPMRGNGEQKVIRTGLWTYEKLGRVPVEDRHEVWSLDKLKNKEASIKIDGLTGALVYPEYLTDDFRLTLANARSAAEHGAQVVTYTKADEMLWENGRITGAKVKSTLDGESLGAAVTAKLVVNAAGPWVDYVRQLENENTSKKLQLTKGIHVVVSCEHLPVNRTIIMRNPDGRFTYAIPREQNVYIGTTDTFYTNAEYWPEITHEDVDYLLNTINFAFNVPSITPKDIIAAWAGLRPLLAAKRKKTSNIPRRHEVDLGPGGMLTVAGGKLTSYRSMAEKVVDLCEKQLGCISKHPPTTTTALPGGDFTGSVDALIGKVEQLGLSLEEAQRAVRLYGSESLEIFDQDEGLSAEVTHAVKKEGALTLEDFWTRRSARARFNIGIRNNAIESAALKMADLLGWSSKDRNKQIKDCLANHNAEMSFLTNPQKTST